MPNRIFRTSLATLAFAACMICGGPAQAVFYGNDYDPVGPLTFNGHAVWQFDDACLAGDGFKSAATCHLTLMSATVHMHDLQSTADLTFGTFDFTHMIDLLIVGGELAGIDSHLIGPSFVTDDGSSLFGPWWLQWSTDLAALAAHDPVGIFTGNCPEGCSPNGSPEAIAFIVTFTRIGAVVPEPGTLGLVLGALGAGWWARRRKTAA
jgi:hypothetical protein